MTDATMPPSLSDGRVSDCRQTSGSAPSRPPVASPPSRPAARSRLVAWGSRGLLVLAGAAPFLALDLSVVLFWDSIAATLGGLLGLELALVIFLNLLGALFLVESVEGATRLPGLRWYARVTPGKVPLPAPLRRVRWAPAAPMGPRRWLALGSRAVLLAVLFYALETALLPFVPPGTGLRFELLLVGAGVLVQVL